MQLLARAPPHSSAARRLGAHHQHLIRGDISIADESSISDTIKQMQAVTIKLAVIEINFSNQGWDVRRRFSFRCLSPVPLLPGVSAASAPECSTAGAFSVGGSPLARWDPHGGVSPVAS